MRKGYCCLILRVFLKSNLYISTYRTIAAVDVSSLNIEALAIMSEVCCKPSSDVTGSDVAAFMTDVRTCTNLNQQRNNLKEWTFFLHFNDSIRVLTFIHISYYTFPCVASLSIFTSCAVFWRARRASQNTNNE